MASTVRARLPPANGDWTNCCVPIDALLTFGHQHVTRRRLARSFAFFVVYLVLLYVTFLPSEVLFMSNSRAISDMMFWDQALTPRLIMQPGSTNSSSSQWWGGSEAGQGVGEWAQYDTWAQTRALFYHSCEQAEEEDQEVSTCLAPPLSQQSTSTQFAACVDANPDLVCMDSLVQSDNCFKGAFGTQVYAAAPSTPAVCVPESLGLYFACGFDPQSGWTSHQVSTSSLLSSAANTTSTDEDARTSRSITVSETILRANRLLQSITHQAGQLVSGTLQVTPKVATHVYSSSLDRTSAVIVSPASVLLCIVVVIDICLMLRRLWRHPTSFSGPWALLDCVMLAMYGLLFYALNFIWHDSMTDDASSSSSATISCEAARDTNMRSYLGQFYGALLGMSFIQILRFLSLLPLMSLTNSSLVRTFANAGGSLFVILVVYMLNALSVMVFFGANSPVFVYFGGSFFSTIILPEGFDVSYLSQQMRLARPNDDIPSFYLTLVVFVINRCVASMVMAFVCIVFWMQKKQHNLATGGGGGDGEEGGSHHGAAETAATAWTVSAWAWFAYYEMLGARPYENVNVETAYARLYAFARERDNLLRNFITYEEIMYVVGVTPGKVGVRTRVQPRQVVEWMQLCGQNNVYLNVDARRCEAKWAEQVVDEGGSRPFKRRTHEQIAVFTSRATRVERGRGLTIRTCIQLAHSVRLKQHQQLFFQRIDPLCGDVLDKQQQLAMDVARLAAHHDLVYNVLPRLGIVMLSQCFAERVFGQTGHVGVNFVTAKKRASPAANKPDEEIGLEIVNELMVVGGGGGGGGGEDTAAAAASSHHQHDRTLAQAKQAKAYNLGMKAAKRRVLNERQLKRFHPCVRLGVQNEWELMHSLPLKVNFCYFLLQGARLRLQSPRRSSSSSSSSSLVYNGRLQLVCRVVRATGEDSHHHHHAAATHDDENHSDEDEWAAMRAFREAAKEDGYTEYAFEQDLARGAEWTLALVPPDLLAEDEFVARIRCRETDTELWIQVELDSGVLLTQLELDSPLQQKILLANVPGYSGKDAEAQLDADVRDRLVLLTHVQGHRVRRPEHVAFATLTFHRFPKQVDEFPATPLRFVRRNHHHSRAGADDRGHHHHQHHHGKQEFEISL